MRWPRIGLITLKGSTQEGTVWEGRGGEIKEEKEKPEKSNTVIEEKEHFYQEGMLN